MVGSTLLLSHRNLANEYIYIFNMKSDEKKNNIHYCGTACEHAYIHTSDLLAVGGTERVQTVKTFIYKLTYTDWEIRDGETSKPAAAESQLFQLVHTATKRFSFSFHIYSLRERFDFFLFFFFLNTHWIHIFRKASAAAAVAVIGRYWILFFCFDNDDSGALDINDNMKTTEKKHSQIANFDELKILHTKKAEHLRRSQQVNRTM